MASSCGAEWPDSGKVDTTGDHPSGDVHAMTMLMIATTMTSRMLANNSRTAIRMVDLTPVIWRMEPAMTAIGTGFLMSASQTAIMMVCRMSVKWTAILTGFRMIANH